MESSLRFGSKQQRVESQAVTQEVIEFFEPQKRLDYHIQRDIPEALFVMADKQYVHQVLLNLLSNAFKYSPKHTSVVISAQMHDNATAKGNTRLMVSVSVKAAGRLAGQSESNR
jgi:signal transduction histidine kinase